MKRPILIFALFTIASTAFAQQNDQSMPQGSMNNGTSPCIDVPLSLTSQDMTLNNDNTAMTSTNKVFVYYHERRRKHRRNETWNANGEIPDNHPSCPLLLSANDKAMVMPQTYKVTVTTPDNQLKVCQDQQAQVAATINVEKTSEYTGNYLTSSNKNEYRRVSKRVYRKTCRKMRKVERKEARLDRLTHVHFNNNVS
jgi:hypothetical protein